MIDDTVTFTLDELHTMLDQIRAYEREECAKVCDKWEESFGKYYAKGLPKLCAEAIRARGNT